MEIAEGEFVAILGHNGSGKSTLAKLMCMLLEPDSGELEICGMRMTGDGVTEEDFYEARRNVGMVFQNPDNQIVATIVEEDVAFGPENLGMPSDEIRRRVDSALATVGMSEVCETRHAALVRGAEAADRDRRNHSDGQKVYNFSTKARRCSTLRDAAR